MVASSERRDGVLMSALLSGWLGYTAAYPTLHTVHATLPTCPFYALTGHPCPFCGGTRSYAAMWRGDLGAAARYYPLGPLLFVLTFAALAYVVWAAVRRRNPIPPLPSQVWRILIPIAIVALGISWTLKLVWLGN